MTRNVGTTALHRSAWQAVGLSKDLHAGHALALHGVSADDVSVIIERHARTGKPAALPARPITTADGGEPVTGRGGRHHGLPRPRGGGSSRAADPHGQRAACPQAVPSGTDGNTHCVTHRVISISRPCVPHVWPG